MAVWSAYGPQCRAGCAPCGNCIAGRTRILLLSPYSPFKTSASWRSASASSVTHSRVDAHRLRLGVLVRLLSFLVAVLVASSGPSFSQPSAALEARVAGLEAQLALRDAENAIALAERDLADAELRYSAARTGQARKGRGNPLSIANPGSRRRWDEAVGLAEAQVATAKLRRANAISARAELVDRLCGEKLVAGECRAKP